MSEKKPEGPRDAAVANPPDTEAAEHGDRDDPGEQDGKSEPKRTHGLG